MFQKHKTIVLSAFLTILMWYDYMLFGYFAAVINVKFLPRQGILEVFLIFAMAYVARPLGGMLTGHVGDKFGRKKALYISAICMAITTFIIGACPAYDQIGVYAIVLIIVARVIQGMAMGGGMVTSIAFMFEHSDPKHSGIVCSIAAASGMFGLFFISVVAYIVGKVILTDLTFNNWGWRIPFIAGLFVMFVARYINNNIDESPSFTDTSKKAATTSNPLRIVMSNHKTDMLISVLLNSTECLLFYAYSVYLPNFVKVNLNINHAIVDQMMIVSYFLTFICIILSGYLSDKFGNKRFCTWLLILITLTIVPILYLFDGNVWHIGIGVIICGIYTGAYAGSETALQADIYPTHIRNTALGISYNLSAVIFGGMTPYLLELITQNYSFLATSYYMMLCTAFSLIGVCVFKAASVKS